jgi:hypothetical protein
MREGINTMDKNYELMMAELVNDPEYNEYIDRMAEEAMEMQLYEQGAYAC